MTKRKKPLTKMQKAWIAALRSGRYKQTTGCLTRKTPNGLEHCCLGVACRVAKKLISRIKIDQFHRVVLYDNNSEVLPPVVCKAFGLKTDDGHFHGGFLTILNDSGKTFAEIADIIESRPEGLFV